MVTISFPNPEHKKFIMFMDTIVGPFCSSGPPEIVDLEFRSKIDYLTQGSHFRNHEKRVDQLSTAAVFQYQPIRRVLVHVPTTSYPCYVRLYYTQTLYGSAYYGYIPFLGSSGFVTPTTGTIAHRIVEQTTSGFILYTVGLKPATNKFTGVTRYQVTVPNPLNSGSAISMTVKTYSTNYTGYLPYSLNWTESLSYEQVKALYDYVLSVGYTPAPSTMSTWYAVREPYGYSCPTPPELVADAEGIIRSVFLEEAIHPPPDWGGLANDASVSLNITDTNVIAFLRDLRNIRDLVPKLRNLRNIRTHANNYLAYHYGILPTIGDLQKIFDGLRELKAHRFPGLASGSAGSTDVVPLINGQHKLTRRLKLIVRTNETMLTELCYRVERLGLFPNLTSIWDLIPFSFVLDWFISVGDWLEVVDTYQRTLRYPISSITMSERTEITRDQKPSAILPYVGPVTVVNYHRWVSDQCPLPTLTHLNSQLDASSHWLEATALIIQRAR